MKLIVMSVLVAVPAIYSSYRVKKDVFVLSPQTKLDVGDTVLIKWAGTSSPTAHEVIGLKGDEVTIRNGGILMTIAINMLMGDPKI